MGRGDAEETREWRQNDRTWFWVGHKRKEGRKQVSFISSIKVLTKICVWRTASRITSYTLKCFYSSSYTTLK